MVNLRRLQKLTIDNVITIAFLTAFLLFLVFHSRFHVKTNIRLICFMLVEADNVFASNLFGINNFFISLNKQHRNVGLKLLNIKTYYLFQGEWTANGDNNRNSGLEEGDTTNNITCDSNQTQSSSSTVNAHESSEQNNSTDQSADSVEKAILQRSYRLQELLESERVYVKDLEQCVDYIKYMRETKDTDDPNEISMPEDLKEGKDRMIFGNIEQIFEWHRE